MVTCGQMTKDEAMKQAEEAKKKSGRPRELELFFENIGITEKEFDEVLSNPLRYLRYLKKKSAALRRIKALKHFVIPQ